MSDATSAVHVRDAEPAAAALVADAERRIAAGGADIAWLDCAIGNHRAARFYEKCGWRRAGNVTSELATPDEIVTIDVWRYEKVLRAASETGARP